MQNQSIPLKCTAMKMYHVQDQKMRLNAFLTEKLLARHAKNHAKLLKARQTSYFYSKLDSLLDIFVFELFSTWNTL